MARWTGQEDEARCASRRVSHLGVRLAAKARRSNVLPNRAIRLIIGFRSIACAVVGAGRRSRAA